MLGYRHSLQDVRDVYCLSPLQTDQVGLPAEVVDNHQDKRRTSSCYWQGAGQVRSKQFAWPTSRERLLRHISSPVSGLLPMLIASAQYHGPSCPKRNGLVLLPTPSAGRSGRLWHQVQSLHNGRMTHLGQRIQWGLVVMLRRCAFQTQHPKLAHTAQKGTRAPQNRCRQVVRHLDASSDDVPKVGYWVPSPITCFDCSGYASAPYFSRPTPC